MKLGTRERGVDPAWTLPTRRRDPRVPRVPIFVPDGIPSWKEGRKEGRKQGRAGGEGRKGKERKGKLGFASRDRTWTTLDRLRRRLYAGRKLTSRTHRIRHGRASLFPSTSPTPHLVENHRVQGRLSSQVVTGRASAWRGLWGRRNAANYSEVGFPSALGAHNYFATGRILGGEVSVASFGHQDGGNRRRERKRERVIKRMREREREVSGVSILPSWMHTVGVSFGFLWICSSCQMWLDIGERNFDQLCHVSC